MWLLFWVHIHCKLFFFWRAQPHKLMCISHHALWLFKNVINPTCNFCTIELFSISTQSHSSQIQFHQIYQLYAFGKTFFIENKFQPIFSDDAWKHESNFDSLKKCFFNKALLYFQHYKVAAILMSYFLEYMLCVPIKYSFIIKAAVYINEFVQTLI